MPSAVANKGDFFGLLRHPWLNSPINDFSKCLKSVLTSQYRPRLGSFSCLIERLSSENNVARLILRVSKTGPPVSLNYYLKGFIILNTLA